MRSRHIERWRWGESEGCCLLILRNLLIFQTVRDGRSGGYPSWARRWARGTPRATSDDLSLRRRLKANCGFGARRHLHLQLKKAQDSSYLHHQEVAFAELVVRVVNRKRS